MGEKLKCIPDRKGYPHGSCIPHGRKVKMYIGSIFHMGNVSHIEERLKCIPYGKVYPTPVMYPCRREVKL